MTDFNSQLYYACVGRRHRLNKNVQRQLRIQAPFSAVLLLLRIEEVFVAQAFAQSATAFIRKKISARNVDVYRL